MQWIHEMMQIGFSYVCGPSNSLIFVCVYLPILLIVFTFDHFVVGLFSIVYLHSSFIFFFFHLQPLVKVTCFDSASDATTTRTVYRSSCSGWRKKK